jgi:hypothetical protein
MVVILSGANIKERCGAMLFDVGRVEGSPWLPGSYTVGRRSFDSAMIRDFAVLSLRSSLRSG